MSSLHRMLPKCRWSRLPAAFHDLGDLGVWATFAALGVCASWPQSARAAEFSLHDAEIVHNAATEAVAYGSVAAAAPANWKSPADYAAGVLHFRLEVGEKPAGTGVMAQVCLQQDGRASAKQACGRDFTFFEKGVYQWSQPLAEFQGAGTVDWTRKPQELSLTVKDCFAKPVTSKATDWVGSPFLTLYYPMRAKLSVVAVSSGGVFSGWPTSLHPIRRPLFPAGAPVSRVRPDGRLAVAPELAAGRYYPNHKAAGRIGAMLPIPSR